MNIAPTNSIRFGQYFPNRDFDYNDSQKETIKQIENALETKASFDTTGRSYNTYLDDAGYDIFVNPMDDKIRVNFVRQPHPSLKASGLREAGVFNYYSDEDTRVGIYDTEHKFDINDVMKKYQLQTLEKQRIKLIAIIPVAIFCAFTLACGITKCVGSKKPNSAAIEQTVQDTTKIAKNTLQLFK